MVIPILTNPKVDKEHGRVLGFFSCVFGGNEVLKKSLACLGSHFEQLKSYEHEDTVHKFIIASQET